MADISIELLQGGLSLAQGNPMPAFDSRAEAKLELIRALLAGTVAVNVSNATIPLPATQVTDLKTVTVTNPTDVSGVAKETTLAAVRDRASFPLPATQVTDLKSVTVSNPTDVTALAREATLAALRDTVFRRTDPLPAGTNTIGHVKLDLDAETMLLLVSEARTASGVSTAFDTSSKSRIALDISVTAISGTLSPALRIFVDRLGADGLWYSIYTSNSITAPSTVSTTIGQGMTIGQSLGSMCRVRWEITGTSPSVTFSASVVGK